MERKTGLVGWAASVIGFVLLAVSCSRDAPVDVAFVDDTAEIMSEAEEASVAAWHSALLARYDIDYRVLSVTRTDDLAAHAVRLFEQGNVGGRSESGRGLLLVVDATNQRVRLEVSRALESVFVDSFVAYLEREQMAPFFASGRVGDGIVATTELIASRAETAMAAAELDARQAAAGSAGAGADAHAPIGAGYERPGATTHTDTAARSQPLDTIAAYLGAMAAHNGSPDLDLYTPATRGMLAGHVVTPAQMDNLVRSYGRCPSARVRTEGGLAVVDHPGDPGHCAPWLLVRDSDGLWRLDLLTMQRAIRFDTGNRWQVAVPDALGDYAFAFDR